MTLLFLFGGFIIVKTGKISRITPMKAIYREAAITETLEEAYGGDIHVHENTWPGLLDRPAASDLCPPLWDCCSGGAAG